MKVKGTTGSFGKVCSCEMEDWKQRETVSIEKKRKCTLPGQKETHTRMLYWTAFSFVVCVHEHLLPPSFFMMGELDCCPKGWGYNLDWWPIQFEPDEYIL